MGSTMTFVSGLISFFPARVSLLQVDSAMPRKLSASQVDQIWDLSDCSGGAAWLYTLLTAIDQYWYVMCGRRLAA